MFVVGAGGIGCELLKVLACSGFRHIEIIDLDTIDVSNLNRQFLFRRSDVGKSKASVARDSVLSMETGATIVAHHGNVLLPPFGAAYIRQFALVFNALDNVEARRAVNSYCVAAGVPLVDGGTAGLNGSVMPIIPGLTPCYDCQPVPVPKSPPVCTVRNTPEKPLHCTLWAKALYQRLFGNADDNDLALTAVEEGDEGDEGEKAGQNANGEDPNAKDQDQDQDQGNSNRVSETATTTGIGGGGSQLPVATPPLPSFKQDPSQDISAFVTELFRKIFVDDIVAIAKFEKLWTERPAPIPHNVPAPTFTAASTAVHLQRQASLMKARKLSSFAHEVHEGRVWKDLFMLVTAVLCERLKSGAQLPFEKDDDDIADWIAAAANLRSIAFRIPLQSRFHCISEAGNIVPAVATTNAIIAGRMVTDAFAIFRRLHSSRSENQNENQNENEKEKEGKGEASFPLYHTYVTAATSRFVIVPDAVRSPNLECAVCAVPSVILPCCVEQWDWIEFIEECLQKQLHLSAPTITLGSSVLFDGLDFEDAVEEEGLSVVRERYARALASSAGVTGTSTLMLTDGDSEFTCRLLLQPVARHDPTHGLVDESKWRAHQQAWERREEAKAKKQSLQQMKMQEEPERESSSDSDTPLVVEGPSHKRAKLQ